MPTRMPVEFEMTFSSPYSPSIEDTSRSLLEIHCEVENIRGNNSEEFKTQADPDETILDSCLEETALEDSKFKYSEKTQSIVDETLLSLKKLSIIKRNGENQNLVDLSYNVDGCSINSMKNPSHSFNNRHSKSLSYEKKYREDREKYVCSILMSNRDGILTRAEYDKMNEEEKSLALKKVNDLFKRLGLLQIDTMNQDDEQKDYKLPAKIYMKNDISVDVTTNDGDMSPPSKIHDSSLIYDVCDENDNSTCFLQRDQKLKKMDKQKNILSPRALFLSHQCQEKNAPPSRETIESDIHTLEREHNEEHFNESTISNPSPIFRQEKNRELVPNINENDRSNLEKNENFKCYNTSSNNNSDSTVASIEIIRSGNVLNNDEVSSPILFTSPTFRNLETNKRIASTSGKKGLDTQRMRLENFDKDITIQDPNEQHTNHFSHTDDIISPSEVIESASQFDCSSIASPVDFYENEKDISSSISTPPLDLGRLSQSPIALYNESTIHHSTNGITKTNREGEALEFSDDDSSGSYQIIKERSSSLLQSNKKTRTILDTVETSHCTLLPRRARYRDQNEFCEIRESEKAPSNVQLKNGTEFHMDPLRIKQLPRRQKSFIGEKKNSNTSSSTASNRKALMQSTKLSPHPFSNFSSREAERLDVVCEWLQERDYPNSSKYSVANRNIMDDRMQANADSNLENGKGVILALNQEQTISVIIHILKSNGSHKFRRKSNAFHENSQLSRSKQYYGGTLLVVRSKDNLPFWESALREKTSFSVLNHAVMATAERRRIAMATKCAGFDIILTTYDALKSKEVATPVDEDGHVVMMSSNENGWFSSRSQSSQQQNCEILSVLHGLHWHRVIFVDELGRQSYLTKPGTSRLLAASALNSNFRMIFFTNCAGCNGLLEGKLKESRRQLCCVARALHMSEERAGDRIVGEAMLDFNDIQEPIDESVG